MTHFNKRYPCSWWRHQFENFKTYINPTPDDVTSVTKHQHLFQDVSLVDLLVSSLVFIVIFNRHLLHYILLFYFVVFFFYYLNYKIHFVFIKIWWWFFPKIINANLSMPLPQKIIIKNHNCNLTYKPCPDDVINLWFRIKNWI